MTFTIEQLKEMIAWKIERKQDPSYWEAKLKEAIEAQLKAEVRASKANAKARRKAA